MIELCNSRRSNNSAGALALVLSVGDLNAEVAAGDELKSKAA